jgi:ParB family chromosome partitioning protein
MLPVAALMPDPNQPRQRFREDSLRQLAASIEQHGVLQPLLVRPVPGPEGEDRYQIVAGERRYRAARLLGLKTLPCQVQCYVGAAAAVVALAENVHREDLGELEKAEALLRIKALTDKTWEQVAELVKLSRDYVKRLVGLLKLESSVKEMVRTGTIPARTAIALKPLPLSQQVEMARRARDEGLSAEQIRELARQELPARPRRRAEQPLPLSPPSLSQPDAGDLTGRSGPVAQALRDCTRTITQIEAWLESQSWTPSRVSGPQKAALEGLYHQVSRLQQQLIGLRGPLRDAEEPESEMLRKALSG